ncbi:beta-lactamase family protein [Candidatus Babeliales bacterium]|nr:beta-lactamase family protein [Candidatus Babeliales bacterium]MBP9844402.1 beta-lactamase family protein [Candidatus Babeliales bacterium]
MLKYCMRMQGIGFLVAVALCGLGLQYYMTNHGPVQLDKETEITTDSGAIFKVDKGWFITRHAGFILIQDPDQQLTYTVIENQEKTAEQAIEKAWQNIKPNFDYILKNSVARGSKDGWEQFVTFEYSSTQQADAFMYAIARLYHNRWYISIIESSNKAFVRKRGAGLMLIDSSFKPAGFIEESFAGKQAHELDELRLQEFIDFVEQARVACHIPGAAIAIVQDGKIILEQGFGVKNLDNQQLVTPETLFMIGSITKSLTTCMMAKLIDEGFFSWDTPVTQLLSTFAVGDEQLTQKLKMIDMVSNANGMPQKGIENIFNYDRVTPESRIAAMKDEKPTTKLGETFQYSNGMVAAGGYIAAHAVYPDMNFSQAYQAAMQKYMFDIVVMKSSTFDFDKVDSMDHADPYALDVYMHVVPTVEDTLFYEPKRPSGAAWSNAHDMAQYLLVQLNEGVNGQGQRVISQKNMTKRFEPQIKITNDTSYGLGLIIENNHGVKVVQHSGGVQGFRSYMFFLPEHNVGCVILANLAGDCANSFLKAVPRKLMEILFDGSLVAENQMNVELQQTKKSFEVDLKDIDFMPTSSLTSQLIGTYSNSLRGDLVIRATETGIELDARLWKSNCATKKKSDDSLNLLLVDGPFAGLKFGLQENDGQMELVIDEGQQKQLFKRVK